MMLDLMKKKIQKKSIFFNVEDEYEEPTYNPYWTRCRFFIFFGRKETPLVLKYTFEMKQRSIYISLFSNKYFSIIFIIIHV